MFGEGRKMWGFGLKISGKGLDKRTSLMYKSVRAGQMRFLKRNHFSKERTT
jgi:hypothetical protein